ncbi:MAG: aldo/keto reductase [Gammaproteobacteria bacterium]
MREPIDSTRRRLLGGFGGALLGSVLPATAADAPEPLRKPVPRSGERLPAIGMGSWITFNVPPFTAAREQRVDVLRSFFSAGGGLVDSSPMYGLSEATIGYCLEQIGATPGLFSATKVWIVSGLAGVAQMNASAALWKLERFDLMQIHNMLDWETHLRTLREWKAENRIRYIGITTSHGRRHDAMLSVIENEDAFDFVQFSYNIADRAAEARLLPAAAAHGKAVIVNRPFRTAELFEHVRGKPLPPWAADIGCASWAQFFLKFAISHPAVTCAIPATSRVDHMQENMQALHGPLPDAAMRARMAAYFDAL